MIFMALSRSKWGVLLFSWSAGVMYSTLFTMPYLLVAHYHETDMVSNSGRAEPGEHWFKPESKRRSHFSTIFLS
jgi:solute carrier family 45 protein 1/2/4